MDLCKNHRTLLKSRVSNGPWIGTLRSTTLTFGQNHEVPTSLVQSSRFGSRRRSWVRFLVGCKSLETLLTLRIRTTDRILTPYGGRCPYQIFPIRDRGTTSETDSLGTPELVDGFLNVLVTITNLPGVGSGSSSGHSPSGEREHLKCRVDVCTPLCFFSTSAHSRIVGG